MEGTGPDRRVADFVVARRDEDTIVQATGDIDAATAPQLRAELVGVMEGLPDRVLLDLTDVDFLDSLGLSVLVAAHRRAGELGIGFALVAPSPPCRRVLEITRLTELFTIID